MMLSTQPNRPQRLPAVAVLVVLLGGVGATWLGVTLTNTPRSARKVPTCTGQQLIVTPGRGGAGMSHGLLNIEIINASPLACALEGYPSLGASNDWHSSLRLSVQHGPSYFFNGSVPRRVVIGPDQVASFAMADDSAYNQAPQFESARRCVATVLSVGLPGVNSPYGFAFITNLNVCYSDWRVTVTPIRSGATAVNV